MPTCSAACMRSSQRYSKGVRYGYQRSGEKTERHSISREFEGGRSGRGEAKGQAKAEAGRADHEAAERRRNQDVAQRSGRQGAGKLAGCDAQGPGLSRSGWFLIQRRSFASAFSSNPFTNFRIFLRLFSLGSATTTVLPWRELRILRTEHLKSTMNANVDDAIIAPVLRGLQVSADSIVNKLTALLADDLDQAAAATLAGRLAEVGQAAAALELLTELREGSRKVTSAAVEALPEVAALLPGEAVVTWIDLTVSLNEQSGAASIKFCKESPGLVRTMGTATAGSALALALELAEQDANVALEGFRQAAGVVAAAGVETLPLWAHIGADLAKLDYVLGIEYLRRGPEILKVLASEDLKAWASVSVKLVTPNSLGKPDYMAALAFFRTSPALLGDLATPAVRRRVLALDGALANHSPEQAVEFLSEAPGWLRRIRDPQWQERVLQYGTLIAERDAAAALEYLRRAPEVIDLADPDAPAPSPAMMDRFDKWYRGGMEVLAYNPDAARAYFAVETRKALEAIEEAASGVALRSVARVLKLFGKI